VNEKGERLDDKQDKMSGWRIESEETAGASVAYESEKLV
jgi:hypothetical protein